MQKLTTRLTPYVIAAFLALASARFAQAVDVHWSFPGAGDWNNAANWDTATVPAAGDNAFVTRPAAENAVAGLTAFPDGNVASLLIGGGGGNFGAVGLAGANLTVTGPGDDNAGHLRVGHDGGQGVLDITSGTLSVAGRSTVGWGSTQDNQINHTGATGGVANFNDLWVGSAGGKGTLNTDGVGFNVNTFATGQGGGNGTTNQTGGFINVTGETHVGADGGSVGVYNLAAGATLQGNAEFMVGRDGGTGTFNNFGNVIDAGGNFHVGRSGGVGFFENNPGATLTTANELNVGWNNGTGTFNNHLGATVEASTAGAFFAVGRDQSTGTFNNDGTLIAHRDMHVGIGTYSHGTLVNTGTISHRADANAWLRVGSGGGVGVSGAEGTFINDGSFVQDDVVSGNKQWVVVGENAKGHIIQSAPTANFVGGITMIGQNGVGTLDHLGGEMHFTELWAGQGQVGNGVINTPGNNPVFGTQLTVSDRLGVGRDGGTGVINQAGGGDISVANQVYVGAGNGAKGTYNLGDAFGASVLNAGQGGWIGVDGATGTLNMSPGSTFNATGGETFIGHNRSTGTVNMEAGGTFNVQGFINIGRDGGTAVFNNNGGTFVNTQELRIGLWGKGTFNNNDGNVTAGTELRIGMGANINGRGDGTFNANGTTDINATNSWTSVGRDGGTGVFNHNTTGALNTQALQIGRGTGDGGQLGADGVYNFKNGNINLSGAGDDTLQVGRDTYGPAHSGSGLLKMTDSAQTLNNTNGRTVVGWNSPGTIDQQVGTVNLRDTWIGRGQDGNPTPGTGVYKISGDAILNNSQILALGSGNTGGGNGTLDISGNAQVHISDRIVVGTEPGGIGTVTQNGGLLQVNGAMTLGEQRNNFAGRSVGHFNKTDGVTQIGNEIDIAATGDGDGFQLAGTTTGRTFRVARDGGVGKFDLKGGTITTPDEFWVGVNGGAKGEFNISGGSIISDKQDFLVGNGGGSKGVVNQSGGSIETNAGGNWAKVGNDGGDGTYNISGGSLTTHNRTVVGWNSTSGKINQTGGTVALSDVEGTWVGRSQDGGNGKGEINVGGTGVLTSNTSIYLGSGNTAGAEGKLTVSGTGTVTQATAQVVVGAEPGSIGTVNISGGTLNTDLRVGENQSVATVNLTGTGVFNQTHGNFHIGIFNGAVGTFNQGPGTTVNNTAAGDNMYLGYDQNSKGVYNQTGGDNNQNGASVRLGHAGSSVGEYNLSGGTLTTSAAIEVGEGSTAMSTFTQTGGSVTAGAGVAVGSSAGGNGGHGLYTMSNGSLTSLAGVAPGFGDNSTGSFVQSGGTVNGGVAVGVGANSIADYTQSGGTANIAALPAPAPAGSGIIIGLGASSTAAYNLKGGDLNMNGKDILLNPLGTATSAAFNMTGGNLNSLGNITGDLFVTSTDSPASVNPGGAGVGNNFGVTTVALNTFGGASSYSQDGGSTLNIQVGGATVGTEYDRLHVTGFATLGGTMKVSASGYSPKTGDYIEAITTDNGYFNLSGMTLDTSSVNTVLAGVSPLLKFNRITTGGTAPGAFPDSGLTVGFLTAMIGDTDLNKTVEFADLNNLLSNYGLGNTGGVNSTLTGTNTAWASGDLNDDRVTDFTDLNALLTNYGLSVPVSAAVTPLSVGTGAVPEPSTWALMALGGLFAAALRLRRRRA